jgi:hypothetical protein
MPHARTALQSELQRAPAVMPKAPEEMKPQLSKTEFYKVEIK